MKLQLLKLSKPLFTTPSGIKVKQVVEQVIPQHILVYHPKTGYATLDGISMRSSVYYILVEWVMNRYPDSLVIDNVYNQVFIYPQNIKEGNC